jgi:hypothetical protein
MPAASQYERRAILSSTAEPRTFAQASPAVQSNVENLLCVYCCAWCRTAHFLFKKNRKLRLRIIYSIEGKVPPSLEYQGVHYRLLQTSRYTQWALWLELIDRHGRYAYIFISRWQCNARAFRRITKIIKQARYL